MHYVNSNALCRLPKNSKPSHLQGHNHACAERQLVYRPMQAFVKSRSKYTRLAQGDPRSSDWPRNFKDLKGLQIGPRLLLNGC